MIKRIHMAEKICIALCVIAAIALIAGCASGPVSLGTKGTQGTGGTGKNDSLDTTKVDPDVAGSNSRFAFNIFRQLNMEDESRSIFISPISISTALAMTRLGAGTATKEAMSKTLEYTGLGDEAINESCAGLIRHLRQLDKKVELYMSNSLWIREGEKIKDGFISANRDIFGASVNFLDFSGKDAANTINRWISGATKKKIEKMIEPPIPPDVVMYLINAIYFKGEWKDKFDVKNTSAAPFYAGNGKTSNAMMMSRNGKAGYGRGDGYRAVRLPYGSGNASMYCVLPDESISINNFIAGLDESRWKDIRDGISEEDDVVLKLPRFKLEYGIKNLNGSLAALGMAEAFSDTADFSGIREGIRISRVLHKAVIEVNEKGSEAAAATVVEMQETAAAEPLVFIADRPFVFIIADDTTGTIMFMGKLYDVE